MVYEHTHVEDPAEHETTFLPTLHRGSQTPIEIPHGAEWRDILSTPFLDVTPKTYTIRTSLYSDEVLRVLQGTLGGLGSSLTEPIIPGRNRPTLPAGWNSEGLDQLVRFTSDVDTFAAERVAAMWTRVKTHYAKVRFVFTLSPVAAPPETNGEDVLKPDVKRMLDILIQGFGLTHDELAGAAGVGRTTLFLWQASKVEPRPGTLKRLLRVYALGRALIGHFQSAEDAAAWLRGGAPSRLSRLGNGEFESVEDEAADLIFAESTFGRDDYAVLRPEAEFNPPPPDESRPPARRVSGRPRRYRLPINDRR